MTLRASGFSISQPLTSAISDEELPFISVLIAARNEEKNIIKCLQSINKIDYPKDKIEILIGDDDSSDSTSEITSAYIADKPEWVLKKIIQQNTPTKGKANVLAQLANSAKGDCLFFTDADVVVPTTWVHSMLSNFKQRTGIVTGVTAPEGKDFFSRYQKTDWLFSLGIIKAFSLFKIPISAMGNNMAVKRAAYLSTGGFEMIPFSLTEDYALFRAILKNEWEFAQAFDTGTYAITLPKNSFIGFLNQRKRWMTGALHLPFPIRFLFLLLGYGVVPVVLLSYLSVLYATACFLFILAGQLIFNLFLFRRLIPNTRFLDLLIYSFMNPFVNILIGIYQFIPFSIEWKGRRYS